MAPDGHEAAETPATPVETLDVHEHVVAIVRDHVLEVTIDRPDRRNALTADMARALRSLLDGVHARPQLRSVLLTGAGDRAFCAGFDIAGIDSPGGAEAGAERDLVNDLATALTELPVPVVGAINGAAVGGGCDLALACDIRIGSPAARFGMPPVKLGLLYAWPGMERLLRAVGHSTAAMMLLTGELVDADQALAIGLLSRLVAPDQLQEQAHRLTAALARNAPISVRASKESLRLLASRPVGEEAGGRLAALQAEVWGSEDAAEGARAHQEGRAPRFTGR